jgi:Na+/melibiose symporter-like transporter
MPVQLTKCDRALLAASNLGVYGCIASFIISSPILYTTYLGGNPSAIGILGVCFGFFNALNGIPIAHAADSGYLNRICVKCFPAEKWGRRAPWIFIGVPLTAVAGFVMWVPPTYGLGSAAIATWYGVVYFLLANGFTAALQSIMASIQELMPDAKSVAQQVAISQPINLIAYTIAGLVIPSIAFTEAPDDATTGSSCCVQPLQRCLVNDKISSCSCFVNSTHFVSSLVQQCSNFVGATASKSFINSKCNKLNDGAPSFQFANFVICGTIVGLMTLTSWVAIIPSRKTEMGKIGKLKVSTLPSHENKNNNVGNKYEENMVQQKNREIEKAIAKEELPSPTICQSLKDSFGLQSFRWTAFANLFANVNEQLTVQLLPFYIVYCVGVDFRDVGSVNALVAGGQLGAALLSVPVFAYILSLEKVAEVDSDGKKFQVNVPKIHPIYFMSFAAFVKLLVQLPLTIMAAVNHDIIYLAAAGFAGGTSTGGQTQVTQVLLGWVMDDDEMRNSGIRREGTIMASNAAIQHCSFVMISGIIATWGALGFDTSKCPMDQPKVVKDAIFYTYTWLNASWLLIYVIALLFYPIK